MTVINEIIGRTFQGESRTKFISLQSVAVNLGGIVFVSLSGMLAEYSWRFPFGLYLLAFIILMMLIQVVTIPAQVDNEIPKRLTLSDIKGVFPAYILGFIGMLFYYIVLMNLPFILDKSLALSTSMIGMVMALMSFISATIAYLFRHLLSKLGERWLLVLCFCCYAIAFVALSQTQFEWRAYVAIVFSGISFGLLLPTLSHLVILLSNTVLRVRLMSGFVMFYFLGQALSGIFLQLNYFLPLGLLFLILAIIAAITACLCLFFLDIKEHRINIKEHCVDLERELS